MCNNLSSFSLLLHWLHVSLPKGALIPSHNSSPSNFNQATIFTWASRLNHFLDKLFKYPTRCAHGAHVVHVRCLNSL